MTWAFEILSKTGFKYDSSIYPIKLKRYGDSSVPLNPFQIRLTENSIWEIPPAAVEFSGRRWPICGGGYLRHFPYFLNKWGLNRVNKKRPAVIYMHPYEFEIESPMKADTAWPLGKKCRYLVFSALQHRNRSTMKTKLQNLLRDFKFGPIVDVFAEILNERK
jgi:hypothetical protein